MTRAHKSTRAVEVWRPSPQQLLAAKDKGTPDVLSAGAKVWFVGVNPGLYSAAIGHHFGRPGNRFWPALARSGFTQRLLSPFEDESLPEYGLGITNLVPRASARAEELTHAELRKGARLLAAKVAVHRPKVVAILGITAYRIAFDRPKAQLGMQQECLEGSTLWVLPNPSGLNAHHQLASLSQLFGELRAFAFARTR